HLTPHMLLNKLDGVVHSANRLELFLRGVDIKLSLNVNDDFQDRQTIQSKIANIGRIGRDGVDVDTGYLGNGGFDCISDLLGIRFRINKLCQSLFYARSPVPKLLVSNPPSGNTIRSVLGIRVLEPISKNFLCEYRQFYWSVTIVQAITV